MNRYLSVDMGSKSESIEDIIDWIENVIKTSSSYDHKVACEKLVTNFTNNILLFKQDYPKYNKAEKFLRKLISTKFGNI